MTKVKGKLNSPRRFKNFLYKRNLVDIYNIVLFNKKMSRFNYQIFKNLEYVLFKKMLRKFLIYTTDKKRFIPYTHSTGVRFMTKGHKSNFINKLNSFNSNISAFMNLKKDSLLRNTFFSLFVKMIENSRGKLGYLNWSLFYAKKSLYGPRNKKKAGWLFIPKRSFKKRFKRISAQHSDALKVMSIFYGFNNFNKFKKLLFFINYSSKIRREAVLHMEGRPNIILYRLNLVSSIFIANKLIKRGMIKLNGRVCNSVVRNLKIYDNLSIDFKIYKFIINMLKKRLKNNNIWSSIPSYIEANFVIMHFSLISFPQVFDLLRFNNLVPLDIFNSDMVNIGSRHFIFK
jgi:ribosomal protein S4